MKKILTILFFVLTLNSFAMDLENRLGLGMTNQVISGLDALSIKMQKSPSFAIGGIIGFKTKEDESNYALGLKFYRNIYDEPQLSFYSVLTGITFTYLDSDDKNKAGYQAEVGLGTEFSFRGLESLGFSFEVGVGYSDSQQGKSFEIVGYEAIVTAVHFYL